MKSLCSLILIAAVAVLMLGCEANIKSFATTRISPSEIASFTQVNTDCERDHGLFITKYNEKTGTSDVAYFPSGGVGGSIGNEPTNIVNVTGGVDGRNMVNNLPATPTNCPSPAVTCCTPGHCPHTPQCLPPINLP